MKRFFRKGLCLGLAAGAALSLQMGCSGRGEFKRYRIEGQRAIVGSDYRAARGMFHGASRLIPSDPENLHDLAVTCEYFAQVRLEQRDVAAAKRELDRAEEYYREAIVSAPGFQAALVGRNRVLELKGKLDQALTQAEWAALYVGPSARQQIFLAGELEERGDLDGALLRYRQAVAMEPDNAEAHRRLGDFLRRHGKEVSAEEVLAEPGKS